MTPEQALARLDRLGSPDSIARYLTDIGCVGDQGAAGRCPVARYVAAETGRPVEIDEECNLLDAPTDPDDDGVFPRFEVIDIGDNVRDFVYEFDAYAYPDLVGDPGGEMWVTS